MRIFLIALTVILLLCIGIVNADGLAVDELSGFWDNETKVVPERQITWFLHWSSLNTGVESFSNGFRIYISNQANGSIVLNPGPGFSPIQYYSVYNFNDCSQYNINQFGHDGFGADTIGFEGFDCQGGINIYSFVWGLATEVSYNTLGYYLCLDSAYFPPDGEWLWTTPNGGFTPSWDGPHCYLIQNNDDDINENVPGIYVTDIEGSWNNGTKVTTGHPVTWTIDVYSASIGGIAGSSNGFRVFLSSDGTVGGMLNPGPGFISPVGDSISGMFETYGYSYTIQYFSNDGFGADTLGFGGFTFGPPSLNEGSAWTITTQIENNAEGYYLCLDSSFFPPGNPWLWVAGDEGGNVYPSWDGPHCYLIENGCIKRGDANHDGSVLVDDFVLLRNYLFFGGSTPISLDEGDVNGDGSILVNDLVMLVNYLFKGGDAPPSCD